MRKGACGGDGSDGFGIQICLFGWCVTLGKPAQDGKEGSTGPSVTINASPAHGTIQTASSELSGITVSIGGMVDRVVAFMGMRKQVMVELRVTVG